MAKQVYANKLAWAELDIDTLEPAQRMAWDKYKAIYRTMKQAKDDFEASMQEGVEEGMVMRVGYNFGKLSVALDVAPAETRKAGGKQSLAAFLATQAQSGARA